MIRGSFGEVFCGRDNESYIVWVLVVMFREEEVDGERCCEVCWWENVWYLINLFYVKFMYSNVKIIFLFLIFKLKFYFNIFDKNIIIWL